MADSDATAAMSESDYPWCQEAVRDVSRTFALTVDLLDEPMAKRICLGYLLCRVADTIEDANDIPAGTQVELLRIYRNAVDPESPTDITEFHDAITRWLAPVEERDDDWRVLANVETILATFRELDQEAQDAMVSPVLEMIDGMELFVERYADTGGIRIEGREELERYCYFVAGTVGNLITNLLAIGSVSEERLNRLQGCAVEFGLLLQLVNVTKDVYKDYHDENNVYVPAEWLAAEGVSQDEIVHPDHHEAVCRVIRRLTTFAGSFLDEGQEYLEVMPLENGNTMSAWVVPYLLAVGTLRELEKRPVDALTERGVKVSRAEVMAIIDVADSMSRDAISRLRTRIASKPFHLLADPYQG